MVIISRSSIDDIIKNWFPIIGILFVVAGMSYLFYEGLWLHLNETGRLILGFLAGIAMISGSYALEKTAKIIADAVLGGGLLMFYLTLIYGSRFETENVQAVIPETWALIIATLFTFGVAYFSYVRHSQYILLVGILGGYLTPFFIGESGGFREFLADTGVFHYQLPLIAFLIYFAGINIAIFLVANRFFLRGIGLLNSLGLFIGTFSLSFFMGGEFPENAANVAVFMIVVVALHIGAMCSNAKKFENENDPYLLAGYLLPLLWFVASMNSFLDQYIAGRILAALFIGCAAIYFGGWHYLKKTLHQAKHTALYVGGIVAIILAITKLHPDLNYFDGPVLALVAMLFGVLYCLAPHPQRELSYFIFSIFGFIVTLWHIDNVSIPDLGIFRGTTLLIIFSLLPFLLSVFFPKREDEHEDVIAFRVFAYNTAGILIFLLLIQDLIRVEDIPRSFIIFTLPAALTTYVSYKKASGFFKISMIKISLGLASAGFFTTFVTFVERFDPFPDSIKFFSTAQSLIGFSTIAIMLLLRHNLKKVSHENPEAEAVDFIFGGVWQFIMTFMLYLCIWSTLTHEILAFLNNLNITGQGTRCFATTLWWVCLGSFMIYIGVKNSTLVNQKNIGFGLLSLTIFKLLFVDLRIYQNINFKIIIFICVGLFMLFISYIANKRSGESYGINKSSS